ncbi:hypothetical protein BZG05_11800 [Salinivibrio kushneri]|nr:hypothetical protein BZG05_11800 [Salinivibrio kushneri]
MMNSDKALITEQQIKLLLSYAVLAPSSHNTQPWRFEITDGTVFMFADETRALAINDPNSRELYISCGCALMNLRAAAAHEGFSISINVEPASGDDALLAVISFNKQHSSSLKDAELFKSIESRRTYRKHFASKDIPTDILDSLHMTASKEDTWLEFITLEESRRIVAELISEGDSIQWSNPNWRKELASWILPRRQGGGLTMHPFLVPVARAIVRTLDMGMGIAAKNKQLTAKSPALAVLGTANDNVTDWLKAGQSLEKILLSAHSKGLQAAYFNQPVQVASLRPKLQSLLKKTGVPQVVISLGFPKDQIGASPRRRLDEVIK